MIRKIKTIITILRAQQYIVYTEHGVIAHCSVRHIRSLFGKLGNIIQEKSSKSVVSIK